VHRGAAVEVRDAGAGEQFKNLGHDLAEQVIAARVRCNKEA
jgi:hypothetical protein